MIQQGFAAGRRFFCVTLHRSRPKGNASSSLTRLLSIERFCLISRRTLASGFRENRELALNG